MRTMRGVGQVVGNWWNGRSGWAYIRIKVVETDTGWTIARHDGHQGITEWDVTTAEAALRITRALIDESGFPLAEWVDQAVP